MNEVVALASVPLTAVALVLTIRGARSATRIRTGFDVARSVVAVVAIVVMAVITGVTTRSELLVAAVIAGGALGVAQGAALRVDVAARGLVARRSSIGLVLWGTGIAVMQLGGAASRVGVVQVGQTLGVFSAAMGIGLLLGRRGPMARARGAAAEQLVGAAAIALVVLVLASAGWARSPEPVPARTALTIDELCALLPSGSGTPVAPGSGLGGELGIDTEEGLLARCMEASSLPYTGQPKFVHVAEFESEALARSAFDDYRQAMADWAVGFSGGPTCAVLPPGDEVACVEVGGADVMVAVRVGRFLVTGESDNLGPEGVVMPIELLVADVSEVVANIEALGAPVPPETEVTEPPVTEPPEPTVTEPPSTVTEPSEVAAPPTGDGDAPEDVTPEEAAASAVAGLVAAAAIGLITWAEAEADTAARMAPDGDEGRDAADAARRAEHDARADRDWADLQRRSREAAADEQRRAEADRQRRERVDRVTERIRDLAEGSGFDEMVERIDRNPVPTEDELAVLRDALARHLADHEAVGAMPSDAELYGDAMSRTLDPLADLGDC